MQFWRPSIATLRELLRSPPRGMALVEFGLAFPFILVLLVGVVDFGLGFYEGLQVQGAAAVGAQYASVHGFASSCPGSTCPITIAVQSATNFGTAVKLTSGYPKEVCGCPSGSGITNETTTSTGTCSGTCPSGDAFGVYAKVSAYLSYTPILPYPGLTSPVALTGVAYRRVL